MKFSSFCFILIILAAAEAFPPQPDPSNTGLYTRSHKQITSKAINQAAVDFIVKNNLTDTDGISNSEILKKYFGTDGDSRQLFTETINAIVNHENKLQKEMKSTAYFHVNGEQIEEAHNFVRSTMKIIKEASTSTPPDFDFIREKLGQIFYTMQSFYSNTNYVNLYGDQDYADFGMESTTLLPISSITDDTCTDCPWDERSYGLGLCENNLISNMELTSGYRSGQDIIKPIGIRKCSHGTMDDATRNSTATGGIYKGYSVNVPHLSKHENAHLAATKAVRNFLINNGSENLLNYIGKENFKNVLNIKSKEELANTSLTFVIDVSGSMADNIEQVQGAMKEIVRRAQLYPVTPYNYILITFSDPVTLQTEMATRDSQILLSELDRLTVSGGDDCPEYSFTGLKRGVEMSRDGASIFLSTDADPKDEHLLDAIITVAVQRAIKISFFLTGNCSGSFKRRKRSYADATSPRERLKRSTQSVWQQIALQTGGAVYETPIAQLQTIVYTAVQDIYPSTLANVIYVSPASLQSLRTSIPVDNTVTLLQIEIHIKSADKLIFSLFHPDGTIMEDSKENITFIYGTGSTNIEVKYPSSGEWELKLNDHRNWVINITAKSMLDFSYHLLDKASDNNSYALNSNPIKNKSYTLVFESTISDNITVTHVDFFNNSYLKETTFDVHIIGSEYISTVFFTNSIAMMRVYGRDMLGNNFVRTLYTKIHPTEIELTLIPLTGNFHMNKKESVDYTIRNAGFQNISIAVTLTDDKFYLQPPTYNTLVLKPGDEIWGTGYIIATEKGIGTYTIEVKDSITNMVLQSQRGKFMVSSFERPYCRVIQINGECPLESLNTLKCSQFTWNSTFSVSFTGVPLAKLSLSNADYKTTLIHENLTLIHGPILASLRSHCCTPSLYVTAVDVDGFFSRCHLSLAKDPVKVIISKQKNESVGDIDTALIITVSLMSIVTVVFLVILKASYSTMKTWCKTDFESSLLNISPQGETKSTNIKFQSHCKN